MNDSNLPKPIQDSPCGEYFFSSQDNIYSNTVFARFFEQNDKQVMGWAENVLAKLEGNGILPVFIKKKENEDFRAFWGTITHMFALIVLYARQYKNIDSNQILFETFIQNRGLITNLVDSQEQMEYLFYNYLDEYSKRGRLDIINKEGELLGELLRLIRYNSLDEFIFALLRPENTGWTMGYSSPTWQRTDCVENVTKAFEYSMGIDNLDKYPLRLPQNISITQDENGEESGIFNTMSFVGTQTVGIDGREDLSKLIIIDPNLSYEISAMIKVSKAQNENLKFGVAGYETTDGEPLPMGVIGGQDSMYFHTAEYMDLPNENIYYHIKGILLANTIQFTEAPSLNFPTGRALSLKANMKYIAPILIQERTSAAAGQPYVYIYDFKVKPLDLPFQQGYLGQKDIIAAYYKNNAYQKKESLENYMQKYLLGYKNILGTTIIKDIDGSERYKILFKVFSDRNRYIAKAKIRINNQTLITDVNGEVSIVLPKGEWKYTVEAENFSTVEKVLLVEDEKVEYIQMVSSAYERVVTFYVRDNSTKEFLSGVKVTFAGKVAMTTSSGIVSFEVYPGTYTMTAEKEDYYVETKTLEITDSVNVDVNMRLIEHYKVTIRVRNGVNPVEGASVLVTGDKYERSTSTNDRGQATGFSLIAGTYHYKVVKEGYITKEGDFTIYADAVIDVEFNPIPKYKINFVVTSNNLPVQKADVLFNGTTLQTDNNGKVSFTEVAGVYSWRVSKTEYAAQTGSVTVVDKDVTVEVSLTQIGYSVTFVVKDEKGNVLPSARVSIGAENIDTSSSGTAVFVKTSGSYQWSVSKSGYYTKQGVVTVSGASETVNVVLEQITYDIVFTIKAEGFILSGQTVSLGDLTGTSDASGIVTFTKPAGRYAWSVSRTDYDTQTGTAVVVDRSLAITVDLKKTRGTLNVTVKDSATNAYISGALITINGQSLSTNSNGYAGTWDLVLGGYLVYGSANGYNQYSGSVSVLAGSNTKTIYMVKEAEKQYTITFTVKEGNTLISGARINVYNGQMDEYLTTDSNGSATISLIKGSYNYICTNGNYFETASGDFSVYGDATVPINLTRKTTSVSVRVRDAETYENIDGASVTFGKYGTSTTYNGVASFYNVPLSDDTIAVTASKLPQYESETNYTTVTRSNPTVYINLGKKKYNVTFVVRDEANNYVSGASVTFNSAIKSTNSSGQAIYTSVPANTTPYNWQVDKSGFQTKTGTVTVQDRDMTVNVTLTRIKCYVTYIVQTSTGSTVSGATVQDGVDSGVTPSSGRVSWYVNAGSSYTVTASHASYFSGTATYTIGSNEQSKTVHITLTSSGALLEVAVGPGDEVVMPIESSLNDLRVQWGDGVQTIGSRAHTYSTGGTYRILFDFSGKATTMSWGNMSAFSLRLRLTKVLGWFTSTVRTNFLEGAFRDCINLKSMVRWDTSLLSGSTRAFYLGCTQTHNFDDFAPITWSSSDYYAAFGYSGLTGTVNLSSAFGNNTVTSIGDSFASSKIKGVTGSINAGSSLIIHGMFYECHELTSMPSDIGLRNVTDAALFCANCSNLPNTTKCTFKSGFDGANGEDMYVNCTSLTRAVTGTIDCNGRSNFARAFAACYNLETIETNAFVARAYYSVDAVSMFTSCKLYDIAPIKPFMQGILNANYMFDNSGVTMVPNQFFSGGLTIGAIVETSCIGTFLNCYNLKIGLDIFAPTFRPSTVRDMFRGCSNLQILNFGFSAGLDGRRYRLVDGPWTNIKDYSGCFNGCSNLLVCIIEIPSSNSTLDLWTLNQYVPGTTSYYYTNYPTGLNTDDCFGGSGLGAKAPKSWGGSAQ